MSTKWLRVKGKVRWCKVYEPEEFRGSTRWITDFYPFDDKEWEKLRASGIQVEKREDSEGGFYVKIRRDVSKLFKNKDELTRFTPPKVTGAVNVSYVNAANGEEVRSYVKSDGIEVKTVGDKTLIGNDSVGIVHIAIFDTAQGKGHRWDGINVLDLVSYDPDKKTEEVKKVEEVKEEPKVSKAKKEEKKTIQEDMNDEIPW